MAVLAVKEYQRIHCGEEFDPANRIVTRAQHQQLERFNDDYERRLKIKVFQHGPRQSLVAQNFVGIINLGRDQVEVLPKIDSATTSVRRSLVRMIAEVLALDLHGNGETRADRHTDSILEILVRLFCEQLWQAVRRGMVRRYEGRTDNLTVLRGRLSMRDQLRENLARPDRLYCAFDEFSENNLLNQVLKAALRVLHRVARSQANLRNIAELLFCFQDVDDVAPAEFRWELLSTDRLSSRYKPLLRMARLFIEGQSPDVVTGAGQGFALLFDMNDLFEGYIGAVARRVFGRRGLQVALQGPKLHLAQHADGAGVFELRPDIVVSNGATVEFIIDTKWKQLKRAELREGVGSADAYQMHAYATQYAAPEVVLLYPHHAELGAWKSRRALYLLRDPGGGTKRPPRRFGVATVDLGYLDEIEQRLEDMFPESARTVAAFRPASFDMGAPLVDLTHATALAADVEDDALIAKLRAGR